MTASREDVVLPPGVTLAPGEWPLAHGSFMFSNLLFFLHWHLAVTSKRLVGETPNTVLGVIPLGSTQVSYPLAAIAGVTVRTRYSAFWLVFGLLFVLAGVGAKEVVTIVIGLLALLAAFRAEISVTNSGGGRTGHGVAFLDRSAAAAFAQQVNTAIATHSHAGLAGSVPAISAPSRSRASEVLDELADLRDAGHITAEEYEAKRREILARL
jgi:hypothetical protein